MVKLTKYRFLFFTVNTIFKNVFDLNSLKENKTTPNVQSVSWFQSHVLSILISCFCKLQVFLLQIQFLLLSVKLEW